MWASDYFSKVKGKYLLHGQTYFHNWTTGKTLSAHYSLQIFLSNCKTSYK